MTTPDQASPSTLLGPPSEFARFAITGLAAYAADVAVFNIALLALGLNPLTSKAVSSVVAITVAFVGSRYYTWPTGPKTSTRRSLVRFVAISITAALVQATCLWVTRHLLGLTSPLADNLSANVIGMGAATTVRYWAFRRFVFASWTPPAIDRRDRGAHARHIDRHTDPHTPALARR